MKTIDIVLYMSELVYDIQNKTYLTGEASANDDNFKHISDIQLSEDEEQVNQIRRSIENSVKALSNVLADHMPINEEFSTNKLGDNKNLIIKLSLPSNFNSALTDSISTAMHQYIVNRSIGEWFLITNGPNVESYMTSAAANINQIRESISKRVRPQKQLNI